MSDYNSALASCAHAVMKQKTINDRIARSIGSLMYNGQADSLYCLVSTGAIPDSDAMVADVMRSYEAESDEVKLMLDCLCQYIRQSGNRAAIPDWNAITWW